MHKPLFPKIDGLESFAGPVVHTGRWDPDLALEGKRVAVIGTGASAIQVVPAIVDEVASLSVFQRTPALRGRSLRSPKKITSGFSPARSRSSRTSASDVSAVWRPR